MSTPQRTTKAERKADAREKARLMREAAARRQRRNRILLVSLAIVLVAAIAVGIGAIVQNARQSDVVATPGGVTDVGGVLVGEEGAPVVSVVLDYQCPGCQAFETTTGPWLAEQREAGRVAVEYRPIAFLDDRLGNDYSKNAANAAFCIADTDPSALPEFTATMYAQQRPEGSEGFTDAELTTMATDAGAGEAVGQCIEDAPYLGYIADSTERHLTPTDDGGLGVGGTPTVYVDGEVVQGSGGTIPGEAELEAAIAAAEAA